MALTNAAVAEKIFEALRDSDDLLDKCQELYGKAHLVCLGLSGEDGPQPEECPVFEVIAWNKERGENQENWPLAFSVNIFLYDDNREFSTTTSGVRTLVNQGAGALETIMDLAQAAITAISAELTFDDLSFDYDAVIFFPLFAGALQVNISFPKLIGGFEPTL
jgi:hypothetical protein